MTSSNPRVVVRGLVLRGTDTKETDRILTVLTHELGLITVIAKGARSRRSRYAAVCRNLAYGELTLSRSGRWYYLTEGATLELFPGLTADIGKLALGAYFAELTEAVCTEGEDTGALLRLLLNALYALSCLDRPARLIKVGFTWRLMALSGFAPLTDACAVCGKEPEEPLLDTLHGVVHCARCPTEGLSVPLTRAALAALDYILTCDPKRLYHFTLERGSLRLLDHAAEAFTAAQLERSFHTLNYYKSVSSEEEL